jgi:hypothetical protein
MADNKLLQNRDDREVTSRARSERPRSWQPPQLLPDPHPQEGWEFRWVRIATQGQNDPSNISSKLREGWEPVRASDHPEIHIFADPNSQFKDNVVIGGLMLCKTPTEFVKQRNDWYGRQSESQMSSVDNNFMRENDPRMPLFKDRQSKVTFGKGN